LIHRLKKIQNRLIEEDIDALVLVPGPTLRYITGQGFDPSERFFCLLIPANGESLAVLPDFEESIWCSSVEFPTTVFGWNDSQGPACAMKEAAASLPDLLSIAYEPLILRCMEYELLQSNYPEAKFVSADSITLELRKYKTLDEIDAVRTAVKAAEDALEELLKFVRVGITEIELANKLSSLLFEKGGESISFGPIVLSGPKSAMPHGVSDKRTIQQGELLLIDFGTSCRGYHCDITRTFVVGAEPDAHLCKIYETVQAANTLGRKAARPGITGGELHEATQCNILMPEFDDYLRHATGHGLGLEVHELPRITTGCDMVLEPGMIFTIEPGLYLDGWGGVRIEDDVLITESGSETLTSFSRDLMVIGTSNN